MDNLNIQVESTPVEQESTPVEQESTPVEQEYWHRYTFSVAPERSFLFSFHEKLESMEWKHSDIKYSDDKDDWELKLAGKENDGIRNFVKYVLCFFAQADGLIMENLVDNFQRDTEFYKEASYFYTQQANNEKTHSRVYALLIETYFTDEAEKRQALNAIAYNKSIKKVALWVKKWMNKEVSLMKRLVAFACVEGIFFSSAFAAIYWIKQLNLLPALTKANEWIARDEAIHTNFAIALYHTIVSDVNLEFEYLEQSEIIDIISSAVEVIEEFTKDSLSVELIGMNADDMIKYIKCTANALIEGLFPKNAILDYKKYYNVTNPFNWMSTISISNKSNFFESIETNYQNPSGEFKFDLNVDF
ncbi:ribonucleotide-diphosphate reductase subunit beta [bacterium]|nr:ribonucleotide-diphosphate reductase subunit beta [bacterium]